MFIISLYSIFLQLIYSPAEVDESLKVSTCLLKHFYLRQVGGKVVSEMFSEEQRGDKGKRQLGGHFPKNRAYMLDFVRYFHDPCVKISVERVKIRVLSVCGNEANLVQICFKI